MGLASRQSGDARAAEQYLRRSLSVEPDSANALSDLATLCAEQSRFEEAVKLFRRALELNPNQTDALQNLGNLLRKLNRSHEGLPLLERLTRIQPRSAPAFRRLGDTYYRLGQVDDAIDAYRRALEIDPDDKHTRVNLGDAYESAGRFKQAKFHYATVLRRDANSPLALARGLQLRDQPIEPEWAGLAEQMIARPGAPLDARIRLNVALGHYYDRQREYDRAFGFLKAGNALQFAKHPYDSSVFSAAIDGLLEVFTPELLRSAPRVSVAGGARPIFILGMPRSGTTLTEQILASHSQVAGGGELATLLSVGMQAQQLSPSKRPYPHALLDLGAAELSALASQYLDGLNVVSGTAPRVTDKLPFNFIHVGLIALLFPEATIVHCRREPLDNALSCFFTSFVDKIQFANDLGTLGRYYVDYARVMKHWHALLPGRILDVQYEELVSDHERVVRGLVAHCGLEWEASCLDFHRTERGVRTPSRWQVRQPIYSGSVARWKRYEKHLGPLRDALGPVMA